mgnify:CR=1 FL=1
MGRYSIHVLIALAMLGCGESDGAEGAEVADAALDGPDAADQGDPCHDTDGDGIADSLERNLEFQFHPDDGDDVPAESDLDSDGDGYSDAEERGDVPDACFPPADIDGDFVPDFLDQDSDGDGIPDAEEAEHGFDRTSPDTDRDGCPDPAELELDRAVEDLADARAGEGLDPGAELHGHLAASRHRSAKPRRRGGLRRDALQTAGGIPTTSMASSVLVAVAGKAVHASEFGSGGDAYLLDLGLA